MRAGAQEVVTVTLDGRPLPFADLARTPVSVGKHTVGFDVRPTSEARLVLPPCAGKVPPSVRVDGRDVAPNVRPAGQTLVITAGAHHVELTLAVSAYEKRVACGFAPRVGIPTSSTAGLRELTYASSHSKGSCARCRPGHALVFVPRAVADDAARKPAPLLLGLHPWNGAIETYAAVADLLEAAEARGVVLLLADGLGNSLYTAAAEDEVLAALDAVPHVLAVDAARTSVFGASMGGAGTTTIAFHHPDRFATATSLFGDSKYDLSSYVRTLIPDEAAAKRVNALDVVDNARNLPVFLIHGDADKSSKIEQSELLDDALRQRGFAVRFDRKPGRGHEGTLVSEYAKEIVERTASTSRVQPTRVSYRSVRPGDLGAYWVSFTKSLPESFVDVERRAGKLVVHHADGVRTLAFDAAQLGGQLPVEQASVPVSWK